MVQPETWPTRARLFMPVQVTIEVVTLPQPTPPPQRLIGSYFPQLHGRNLPLSTPPPTSHPTGHAPSGGSGSRHRPFYPSVSKKMNPFNNNKASWDLPSVETAPTETTRASVSSGGRRSLQTGDLGPQLAPSPMEVGEAGEMYNRGQPSSQDTRHPQLDWTTPATQLDFLTRNKNPTSHLLGAEGLVHME